MFDIGWTELLVIAVVMIIVVGPKDLPAMLRTMGRYAGKLRRTASEFRGQFEDAIRESELEDVRNELASLRNINPANAIKETVSKSLESVSEPIDEAGRNLAGPTATAKAKTPRKKTTGTKTAAPKKVAPKNATAKKPAPKKTTRARKPRATSTTRKARVGAAKSGA